MPILSDYDLILPQVPSKEEWQQEIAGLGGILKEAAVVRARACNLLREINEKKATAERVGWLNLWAKTFAALDSAVAAYEYRSGLVLQMISRGTFEWLHHVRVIYDPIDEIYELEKSNKKVAVHKRFIQKTVVDRLRAYTTWCLWSDKVFYEDLLDPENLAGVWDSAPARELIADEKRLEMHEQLFGPIEIETDEKKLKESRHKYEKVYKNKVDCIDHWLSDPQLKLWIDKIRIKKKKQVGFLDIFDISSIRKYLENHNIKFGYAKYKIGSMILHGSSMKEFMIIGISSLTPKIVTDQTDLGDYLRDILFECNYIYFYLAKINHFVFKM